MHTYPKIFFAVFCLLAGAAGVTAQETTATSPFLPFPAYNVVHDNLQTSHLQLPQNPAQDRGGLMAGLKSIVFGPRVGIESNEDLPVTFIEKANVFVPLVPFLAYSESGWKGFMSSAFIGPRVGMELKERKIRLKEWVGLVPVLGVTAHLMMSESPSASTVIVEVAVAAFLSRLWPAFDAFRGSTMTDIDLNEGLRR